MRAEMTPVASGAALGAEPVGALADAPEAERRVVCALRLWLAAPEGRRAAEGVLGEGLDPARARAAACAFDAWLGAVAEGAARKLWRHAPGCPCLGRDEAALAGAVREAAAGRREAAWAMLAPCLRVEALFAAAEAAGALGRALSPCTRH
jgi:hypothetical protein